MHLLELVGVADQADKLPSTLSGGQQQRVAIVAPDQIDPRLRWNMTASVAIEPR